MKTMKFKPSEVGPVPVDWEVKRLGGCCKKIGSGATPTGGATVYLSHGVSLIRSQNVYNGYFKYEGLVHITDSAASALDGVTVQDDDVLLNITGDSVARCTKVPADVLPARVNQHVAIIRTCSEELGSDYLQCYLASPDMQTYMLNAASGQGGSRNAMTKGMVEDFQIPIPPLPEQKAIAEALSDVDALLAAITKLIEKKRAIKQGAMQQLLTGKKRLAGFTGKWVEKRLGDCALIKARIGWQGLTTAEYLKNGPYYLITGSDFNDGRINWSQCYFVDKARYDQDKYIQIKKDDVLVSKDGTIGKVAFLDDVPGEGTLNSGVFVIRSTDKMIDQPYLAWVFLSRWFDDFIDRLVAGSTIVHLYQKDIVGFEFPVPPTFAEQKAIAAVLSDMDAEIASLESKRAKYESIKQGMMQELLTGKARLV